MDTLEPNVFNPIPSLVPGEVGMVFLVPNSKIGSFEMPVPLVTSYRAFKGPSKVKVNEEIVMGGRSVSWGDMVFTHLDEGPQNYMAFYFHVDRTKAMVQKPIKTQSHPTNRPYVWPNALVYLGALEDNTQPLSFEMNGAVVTLARLYERIYKVPEQEISTDIDVEVFVSNAPFPRVLVKTDVPVQREVRWHDRNIEGSLMCVHPYLEFPEVQKGATRLTGWGTTRVRSPMGGGKRVYKATKPHTTWADHTCSATPNYDAKSGQWMLTREIVRVPEGFEAIKDLSY